MIIPLAKVAARLVKILAITLSSWFASASRLPPVATCNYE
jgi:hypothetical protein